MSQLIIDFCSIGRWSVRRRHGGLRRFKSLIIPKNMLNNSIVVDEIDNRDAWRKRLDEHARTADYEIIKINTAIVEG